MRPYSSQDIPSIYSQTLDFASQHANEKHWQEALDDVETAAVWAYHFSWIYTDPRAEQMIRLVADATLKKVEVTDKYDDRVVMIDSFCWDNHGLTQQYLRAMMQNAMTILYICTSNTIDQGSDILHELGHYAKAEVLSFTDVKFNQIEKSERMCETISRFAPAHLFLHISPWDSTPLLTCHALSGVNKYNINITDHAYWLGASFVDYNIEFRPYGETVSIEKRGFQEQQLLVLPFYPIMPVTDDFKGFPEFPSDAVTVFTGGALYKMLGRQNIFFRLMDAILAIAPNVYILVAGFDPDKRFDQGLNSMRHKERVFQLGPRSDINAVFENTDIFLGTYPTSGGLMNQFAARHGKPIIAYCEEGDAEGRIEELLNHQDAMFQSFSVMDDLMDYAKRLILDKDYRIHEGDRLKRGLMTEERFAQEFCQLVSTRKSDRPLTYDEINYETFFHRYLDLENQSGFPATKQLVLALKMDVLKSKVCRINLLEMLGRCTLEKLHRSIGH